MYAGETIAGIGVHPRSNIVGYQNKSLKADYAYNLSVATFKAVGKDADKMVLGDIAASDGWVAGSDKIMTLLANGAVDQTYTYVGKTDATSWGCPVGWYLKDDVDDDLIEDLTPYCKNSDPLPLGNGLLVLVGSSSTTLTYAGEVITGDTPVTLETDYAYNITGNASPVGIKLGDITASKGWVAGSDKIMTLLANGAVDQTYTYVGEADATAWGCPVGWYLKADVDDDLIEDLTPYCKNSIPVSAGEAFIVVVGTATTTITIPSAL